MSNNPAYWFCPYCGNGMYMRPWIYAGGGDTCDEWEFSCICGATLRLQPPTEDDLERLHECAGCHQRLTLDKLEHQPEDGAELCAECVENYPMWPNKPGENTDENEDESGLWLPLVSEEQYDDFYHDSAKDEAIPDD